MNAQPFRNTFQILVNAQGAFQRAHDSEQGVGDFRIAFKGAPLGRIHINVKIYKILSPGYPVTECLDTFIPNEFIRVFAVRRRHGIYGKSNSRQDADAFQGRPDACGIPIVHNDHRRRIAFDIYGLLLGQCGAASGHHVFNTRVKTTH
ncbi:MAG: hypothetical protein BWX80_04226 [Candidatus Hydrogenedentes bacterium ADurb.Bin101]|nr:MAG: hypothetical protein BWX80_04226 [Candidatus Hydrogenedentes bacterium ADurb.Bin101]